MPAPNNKANRETLKAIVRTRLSEGKTEREAAEEVGVSRSTVHRWSKETTGTEEMEIAKKALTALDVDLLSKTSHFNHLVLDEMIKKAHNNELEAEDLKTLSRIGVEVSKTHGIHWDKVTIREGGLVPGHSPPSVAALLALALSKAEGDRQATARIEAETKAYEVMKAEGKAPNVIDVEPLP